MGFLRWFSDDRGGKGEREEPLPPRHEGLPNSDVRGGLCPRCLKQSSFDVLGTIPVTFEGGYAVSSDGSHRKLHRDQVSVLICRHCEQGVVVVEEQYLGEQPEGRGGRPIRHRGIHWWPLPVAVITDDIPEQIGVVYDEAQRALAARCPRAAAVMARRTLEAVAADHGKETGSLFERLNSLSADGKLHPTLVEWTTQIRLIGNVGAHFDPVNDVSIEEATVLLEFTRELLRYLYEYPKRIQRLRNAEGDS